MPPEDKEQDGNEKKNNFSSGDLFHKAKQKNESPNSSDNNTNKNKKQSFEWWRELKRAEKIQISGLLLTFFTLVAFIWISSVQISKTAEALERADTSNAYVLRSIVTSQKNAKVELRAYVQVTDAIIKGIKVNNRLHIVLNYRNAGLTPAYDVEILAMTKPGGTGIYDVDWDTTKMKYSEEVNFILGANATFNRSFFTERYITKNDSIHYMSGQRLLAFYGYIFYKDIFSDSHYTRFCLKYVSFEKKFILYKKYNDADKYPY